MDSPALLARLPVAVEERVRPLSAGPLQGAFVLVWMRVGVRAHDNPALDAALLAGDALGLPVFVYHALSERYPYASDRHHRFILEGARDVAVELAARGIGTAFHLERPGHRGPHLRTLAAQAALVVTEDLPVPPLTTWSIRLRDAVDTPVWAVDTACILPMRLVDRPIDRAFAFRNAFAEEREERLDAGWEDVPVTRPGFVPPLPFTPVDLATADLSALIARCDIDHSVGPVPHTPGGSVAGYARWAAFVESGGLARYASTRNDPARDGVSRMSAYLHYGHVSPFRLAADCAGIEGRGPAKYLDELLVWRELAHAWCSHQPALHTLGVLPDWARGTLARHAGDPRPKAASWETLARARTGDALWDACQRSLLQQGELHNNVRMTWGKMLVPYTRSPEEARAMLVDLNHRYALDGRDPSSYGGLYWCLGLFDRPFRPEAPIRGCVRDRSSAWHAGRVRMDVYRRKVTRPLRSPVPRVAVVGAGLAGLACARTLADHGVPVVVFEAQAQVGGRLGHPGDHPVPADAGAQFFSARSPAFRRLAASWVRDGVAAVWEPRSATPRKRLVGTPDMGALARHVARDLDVRPNTTVLGLTQRGGARLLQLASGDEAGPFDRVVLALPPRAAAALHEGVEAPPLLPCVAVVLRFAQALTATVDVVEPAEGPIGWACRDASKPGRPPQETWVVHATPAWSAAHLGDDDEALQQVLAAALADAVGDDQPAVVQSVQRWPGARAVVADNTHRALDLGEGVWACGDWLGGPRVEGAWVSGVAVAGRLLGQIADAAAADRARGA